MQIFINILIFMLVTAHTGNFWLITEKLNVCTSIQPRLGTIYLLYPPLIGPRRRHVTEVTWPLCTMDGRHANIAHKRANCYQQQRSLFTFGAIYVPCATCRFYCHEFVSSKVSQRHEVKPTMQDTPSYRFVKLCPAKQPAKQLWPFTLKGLTSLP